MTNPFQQAIKAQLKARVAFDGPTGSGKTWTALAWATTLKGDGRVAFIDTERDSAKLYANHFDFDVLRFEPPYEVDKLIALLKTAQDLAYTVVVVDSLSHFWEGEGGVLDEVDAAGARAGGNSFAGWKHGTPLQRHMVDTFLALDMHVIVCMRSKMEYVLTEYTDGKGNKKTKPEKIGMAPVQRGGLEYEFTLVGDLDLEHRITFSKSRCDVLADKMIQPHREREAAEIFRAWLDDGEPPPPMATPEERGAFVDQIKAIEIAAVKAEMIAWWREMGYTNDTPMSQPDLAAARGHLADLLIEHAEVARGNDDFAEIDGSEDARPLAQAAPRVPEPSSTIGEPGNNSGERSEAGDGTDLETGSEPADHASNGHGVAASPIAEEVGAPSASASSVEKPKCSQCGSTKAGLEAQDDGTYVCTIRASCDARAQLAGVGGKAAE